MTNNQPWLDQWNHQRSTSVPMGPFSTWDIFPHLPAPRRGQTRPSNERTPRSTCPLTRRNRIQLSPLYRVEARLRIRFCWRDYVTSDFYGSFGRISWVKQSAKLWLPNGHSLVHCLPWSPPMCPWNQAAAFRPLSAHKTHRPTPSHEWQASNAERAIEPFAASALHQTRRTNEADQAGADPERHGGCKFGLKTKLKKWQKLRLTRQSHLQQRKCLVCPKRAGLTGHVGGV